MQACRLQFIPAFIAILFVMILYCSPAQAGYVSVAASEEIAGANSFTLLSASPFYGIGTSGGMDSAAPSALPRLDLTNSPPPSKPVWPSRKLPRAADDWGHTCGSGSSSTSSSNKGPSSAQDFELPRPQLPPFLATGLLPPETGDTQLCSTVSSLFHPPRAV